MHGSRTWIVAVFSATALLAVAACTHRADPSAGASRSAPPGPPTSPPALSPSTAPAFTPTPTTAGTPTTPAPTPTVTPTGERAQPRTTLPTDWADLGNATLDLPAWGSAAFCPHGQVTLTNGWFPDQGGTDWQDGIGSAVALDLDGDGVTEAVVRFDCQRSDPGMAQVVGFARTAGGGIRTLGVVVGPGGGGPTNISDLVVSGDRVSVSVDNTAGSSGSGVEAVLHQLRTYGWDGSAFQQTGGPTSFVSPALVSGHGGDMEFSAPVDGKLLGTMTVTLRNAGATTVSGASLVAAIGDTTLEPIDTPDCRAVGAFLEQCDVPGSLAPGHTYSATLRFTLPVADADFLRQNGGISGGGFQLQVWVGNQKTATNPTYGATKLP